MIEHGLGGVADQQSLDTATADRPHHDNIGAFVGRIDKRHQNQIGPFAAERFGVPGTMCSHRNLAGKAVRTQGLDQCAARLFSRNGADNPSRSLKGKPTKNNRMAIPIRASRSISSPAATIPNHAGPTRIPTAMNVTIKGWRSNLPIAPAVAAIARMTANS